MKRCAAKPYEGQEKYIFVSYCHKDRAYVFPIIEHLAKDGYRIWYDEGIEPGTEWPEIIAKHLNGAAICIAFVTENSLNSHNCRREINFALLKRKYFISVILEPVQMSLGMEMQLSSAQSIIKYSLPSEEEFFVKLYDLSPFLACKGEPNHQIVVSSPTDYLNATFDERVREPFSEKWFTGEAKETTDMLFDHTRHDIITSDEADYHEVSQIVMALEAKITYLLAEQERIRNEAQKKEARIQEEIERQTAELERLRKESQITDAKLQGEIDRYIAEQQRLKKEIEKADRRKKEKDECRFEADIITKKKRSEVYGHGQYIEDSEDSTVFADMESDDTIFDDKSRQKELSGFQLVRMNTGEVIDITRGAFVLGRSQIRADYVLSGDKTIGRVHAIIIADFDHCVITDNKSLNKTKINGKELAPEVEYNLQEGDILQLQSERFLFRKAKK